MKAYLIYIRSWFALLFIFVLPWENILMFENGETISKLLGIAVAAFWVFTVFVLGRARAPLPFHLAVLVFALWNLFSTWWSVDPERSFERATTYIQIAILVYILWDIFSGSTGLIAILQAYILGACVTAGSTLYSYINASAYYYNRYAASGFNPNDASLILALGLPIAWCLTICPDRKSINLLFRFIALVYIPAAIYAIFLTGSRGSLAAAAATTIFVVITFFELRPRTRIILFTVSTIASYFMLIMVPTTSIARLETKGLSLNGREEVWEQVVEVIADYPILGVGSAAVKTVIEREQAAHNFVLAITSELGIVGISLFSIILVFVILHAVRQERRCCYLWLTVLLIWAVGSGVHNFEHRKQTWLIFSFVIISSDLFKAYTPYSTSQLRSSVVPK